MRSTRLSIHNTLYVSTRTATPRPAVDGAKLLDAIVKRGGAFDEAALWESSPVRIDWPPERDGIEVLPRLYRPEHHLFLGTRFDFCAGHVLPVSEWITRFERGISIPEHIVPNPLSGKSCPTKDGKRSYRADSCVAQFRLATVEFDTNATGQTNPILGRSAIASRRAHRLRRQVDSRLDQG